jgi:hypothetical protein
MPNRVVKDKDIYWKNKHEFLSLPVDKLDKFNISSKSAGKLRPDVVSDAGTELKGRSFS